MNILTDLPHEIYFLIANYLDLSELGTLLFTCKNLSERIGADFLLQKVFLDNTPVKRGPSMFCLNRKFIQSRTTQGIQSNHPHGVLMSFRDLQHETILEVMQQNNDKVSKEMKKGILNKIHQYDADKVLSFVIESYDESASATAAATSNFTIAEFILIIATRFIDTHVVKIDAKPQLFAPNCTKRTLDLLTKYRDIVLESLIGSSRFAFTDPLTYIRTIIKLNEVFPDHAFDLKSPVNSSANPSRFIVGHKIPLLEYMILYKQLDIYDHLTGTNQLIEDPNAPYLALTYHTKNKYFRDYIQRRNIGASNHVMPSYLHEKPTSILVDLLNQKPLMPEDYYELEAFVISKKFQLLPEEVKEFSSMPETSIEHKLAKCFLDKNYSPFNHIVTDFEEEISQQAKSTFRNRESFSYLELTQYHRTFEYYNSQRFLGTWTVNGSNLVCTSTKKRWTVSWGSYSSMGSSYEQEAEHHEVFTFCLFRMFDGTLAAHIKTLVGSAAYRMESLLRLEQRWI